MKLSDLPIRILFTLWMKWFKNLTRFFGEYRSPACLTGIFCNNYDFRIISEFQIHRLWKNFQLGKKMTSPIFTQLVTSIFFYKNVLCFFNTYLKDLWGNQETMSHIKKCIMNWCLTYCIFFSYFFPSSLHFLLEICTRQERIFFT